MEANIGRNVQISAPGRIIELYDVDFTPINALAGMTHFYPSKKEDGGLGSVTWRGNVYVSLPMQISGIVTGSKGALPRPVIKASNVLGTMTNVYKTFGTVSGAILTRWVTFEQFLDGGAAANPDSHLPIDQWVLDRVTSHNKVEMAVECRSLLDFNRKKLPARQMLRSNCSQVYRVYDPDIGGFDYTKVTCPYRGALYFDETGQPTSIVNDKCSKKLTGGCVQRFGTNPLPFRGFPGMGRFQ